MTSTLDRLRQNDPQQTSISIHLDGEGDDADATIAQALEHNQHVSQIELVATRRPQRIGRGWDNLYHVLATRGTIVRLILVNLPEERIRPILQAIQQNTSVRVVECRAIRFTVHDLCFFLDNADHVSDLTLERCLLLTEGAQGARDVVAALQRTINIQTLKLLPNDNSLWNHIEEGLVLNTTIEEGLVLNTSVKNLALSANTSHDFLKGLVESTRSIQHLELRETVLVHSVAQGIINASSITAITFSSCNFRHEGPFRFLSRIVEQKHNLSSLVINDCNFNPVRLPQFLQVLSLALRRGSSSLRCFGFENSDFRNSPDDSFSNLCEAVANSKLHSFSIGSINDRGHCTALANAIPSMKVQKLVIRFAPQGYRRRDTISQMLRDAVHNNYTLQSVKHQMVPWLGGPEGWDDETLQFYVLRNIRLAQWVENPTSVPKHLWKEATTLAAQAGHTMLFRLLRKIGPAVLPQGSRKRKRQDE